MTNQAIAEKPPSSYERAYRDKPWETPWCPTDVMWEVFSPFHTEAARVTYAEFQEMKAEGILPGSGVLADVVQRRVWLAHNERPWHPDWTYD